MSDTPSSTSEHDDMPTDTSMDTTISNDISVGTASRAAPMILSDYHPANQPVNFGL